MVTLALSSLVPWPKELSEVPLGLSMPVFRPTTFTQSVLPLVLTTRLPSLPSKVLPDRFASAGRTPTESSMAIAANTHNRRHHDALRLILRTPFLASHTPHAGVADDSES